MNVAHKIINSRRALCSEQPRVTVTGQKKTMEGGCGVIGIIGTARLAGGLILLVMRRRDDLTIEE